MSDTASSSASLNSAPALRWSFRLGLVCMAALSVSLPIAWISLAKVLVFLAGLGYLVANRWRKRHDPALAQLWTTRALLVIPIVFALSLLWTEIDLGEALTSYVKHAKLLGVLLIVYLLRTAQEARVAVRFFAFGQVFLLLSSWMLFLGLPVPWAIDDSITKYIVFSTYLDQSIMLAATAAVFWHMRGDRLWPRWMGPVVALLGLADALLLLEGRTGYFVALAMLSLAAMWAMPKRLRLAALIITPAAVLLALTLGSTQVQERVVKAVQEGQDFAQTSRSGKDTSIGWRLNAWHRSLQAMQQKPLHGFGVGSWTPAVKRIQGANASELFGEAKQSNPHQEYLLWGVEIGVGGLLLFLALFACLVRDARTFPTSIQYATLSMVAAMAVACLFNSTLYDDWIGDFFCFGLGLMLALGVRSRSAGGFSA
jgi:O-antigen ligase